MCWCFRSGCDAGLFYLYLVPFSPSDIAKLFSWRLYKVLNARMMKTDWVANSVDPDQMPQKASDLGLHCFAQASLLWSTTCHRMYLIWVYTVCSGLSTLVNYINSLQKYFYFGFDKQNLKIPMCLEYYICSHFKQMILQLMCTGAINQVPFGLVTL